MSPQSRGPSLLPAPTHLPLSSVLSSIRTASSLASALGPLLAFHSHTVTSLGDDCHRSGSWGRRFCDENGLTGGLLGIYLKLNICGGITEAGLGRGTSWAVRQTPPRDLNHPLGKLCSWNSFSQWDKIEVWGLGSRPHYGPGPVGGGQSQEGE